MGTGSGKERRKYARIPTQHVISFAPVAEKDLLGVTRDVSPGGIRFEAIGCEIELGDLICVTFNVADRTLTAVGRVAWSTELDPLTLDVGLEFVEIDPNDLRILEQELNVYPQA